MGVLHEGSASDFNDQTTPVRKEHYNIVKAYLTELIKLDVLMENAETSREHQIHSTMQENAELLFSNLMKKFYPQLRGEKTVVVGISGFPPEFRLVGESKFKSKIGTRDEDAVCEMISQKIQPNLNRFDQKMEPMRKFNQSQGKFAGDYFLNNYLRKK